jgi:hypothetical protein
MYFSYDHLEFKYEPFPIGLAKPLMDAATYKELVDNYPPIEHFKFMPKLGKKYTLSERFNKAVYEKVIRDNPVWREFHRWLKSDEFVMGVLQALREHHIDLGYDLSLSPLKRLAKLVKDIKGGAITPRSARLKSRFEFSMLPADGGNIQPHTDSAAKVITLVVSMLNDNEWDPRFGGGTDVNRPKDITRIFNELNTQGEFEDMEVVDSFEFTPNQAVIFIRTFNSWHSVRPMTGSGSPNMRKTLTINIERHL